MAFWDPQGGISRRETAHCLVPRSSASETMETTARKTKLARYGGGGGVRGAAVR